MNAYTPGTGKRIIYAEMDTLSCLKSSVPPLLTLQVWSFANIPRRVPTSLLVT
jgi:hypothetical protein